MRDIPFRKAAALSLRNFQQRGAAAKDWLTLEPPCAAPCQQSRQEQPSRLRLTGHLEVASPSDGRFLKQVVENCRQHSADDQAVETSHA